METLALKAIAIWMFFFVTITTLGCVLFFFTKNGKKITMKKTPMFFAIGFASYLLSQYVYLISFNATSFSSFYAYLCITIALLYYHFRKEKKQLNLRIKSSKNRFTDALVLIGAMVFFYCCVYRPHITMGISGSDEYGWLRKTLFLYRKGRVPYNEVEAYPVTMMILINGVFSIGRFDIHTLYWIYELYPFFVAIAMVFVSYFLFNEFFPDNPILRLSSLIFVVYLLSLRYRTFGQLPSILSDLFFAIAILSFVDGDFTDKNRYRYIGLLCGLMILSHPFNGVVETAILLLFVLIKDKIQKKRPIKSILIVIAPIVIFATVWIVHISISYNVRWMFNYVHYLRVQIPVFVPLLDVKMPFIQPIERHSFMGALRLVPLFFVPFSLSNVQSKRKRVVIFFSKLSYVILLIVYGLPYILEALYLSSVNSTLSQTQIFSYLYRVKDIMLIPIAINFFFGVECVIRFSKEKLANLLHSRSKKTRDWFRKNHYETVISFVVFVVIAFTRFSPVHNIYYYSKDAEDSALFLYDETRGQNAMVSCCFDDESIRYSIASIFEYGEFIYYNEKIDLSTFLEEKDIDYFASSIDSSYHESLLNGQYGSIVWNSDYNRSIVVKIR